MTCNLEDTVASFISHPWLKDSVQAQDYLKCHNSVLANFASNCRNPLEFICNKLSTFQRKVFCRKLLQRPSNSISQNVQKLREADLSHEVKIKVTNHMLADILSNFDLVYTAFTKALYSENLELKLQTLQSINFTDALRSGTQKLKNQSLAKEVETMTKNWPKSDHRMPWAASLVSDCYAAYRSILHQCVHKIVTPCRRSSIRAAKVFRLTMTSLQELIKTFPSIKILYYIRDPRGIIFSRGDIGFISKPDPQFQVASVISEAQKLCARMHEDLLVAAALKKRFVKITAFS